MLGIPVTDAFVKEGYSVSVFVRNQQKAQKLFGEKVQITQGDLSDLKAIEDFLKHKDVLYVNLSVEQGSKESDFQPEREGLNHIVEVAKKNQIKRIGYMSSLVHFYQGMNGFDWWVFKLKANALELIKSSGIPYTIFYPSTFMENFDKGAYIQGNNALLAGVSKYKMYFIAGEDYGRQVVKAFEINKGNHEYPVQGPEGFTADEAAHTYVTNYKKKKLGIMKAPIAILWLLGLFSTKFNYGYHIIDALNNYPEKFESERTWAELGEPRLTLTDYVERVNNS